MDYGYTFLRGSVGMREEGQKAIREMDIRELRGYLCAKTMGNPKTCISCDGFRKCQVGQRALVLMHQEEAEKAQYKKVWDEKTVQEARKEALEDRQVAEALEAKPGTQSDKDNFLAACESGNARRWLSEKGYSDAAGQEKLVFWVKHYPDITRQYGRKRIMQKQKKLTVTSILADGQEEQMRMDEPEPPVEATPAPVSAAEEQSGQTPDMEEKPQNGPEKGKEEKRGWTPEMKDKIRELRHAIGRRACMEALASGDPIAYMISHGKTRNAANQSIIRWHKIYPDLFEKQPEQITEEPQEEPREEPQPSAKREAAAEGDEISLLDFLKEYGIDEPVSAEPTQEERTEPDAEGNANGELARMMKEEAGLLEQVAALQSRIWEIRKRRREIERKMSH